jgi:GntR family transcriptional repressor for pyruvate dehydrogenase complex
MSTRAPLDTLTARDRVVEHVRQLIERGAMKPGDRLPSERDLAGELGVSRPSVRSGLEALEAMGVVVSRRGAGTFIAEGPPDLGIEPLSLLASLHGFTPNEMFEARLVLEVGVAGLAAGHASAEHLAAMAEEVTEMFASLEDPAAYLVHDVRFHRAIAAGCGNRVLAALMEMVSAQFYELRRETIAQARDLRESAEMHRRVYRAIRSRNAEAARIEMTEHLRAAQHAQTLEREPEPPGQDTGGPREGSREGPPAAGGARGARERRD